MVPSNPSRRKKFLQKMMAILLVLVNFIVCIEAKGGKGRGGSFIFCFSDCEWWEYLFTAIFLLLIALAVGFACYWGINKLKEHYFQ